jgi:hypothetical protein
VIVATAKQVRAVKQNVKKSQSAARIKRQDLPGRSKMGRAELARALGLE